MVHNDSHTADNIPCLYSPAVFAPVAILEGKELVEGVVGVLHCQPL